MKLKPRYPRHDHQQRQHTQAALSRKAIVSLAISACLMNSSLLVCSLRHPRPQPRGRVMPAFLTRCGVQIKQSLSPSLHPRILSASIANQNNNDSSSQHYTTKARATLSMSGGNNSNDESLENNNDTSNKINERPSATQFTASPWGNRNSLVGALLEKTTSRAMRTLSTNAGGDSDNAEDVMSTSSNNSASDATIEDIIDATIVRSSSTMNGGSNDNMDDGEDTNTNPNVESVLDASISRSSSILEGNNNNEESSGSSAKSKPQNNNESKNSKSAKTDKPKKQHQEKRTYLGNPSVTPTALAHSLWQSTILPYEDTIIDATCGNGKDCLALAKMLFPDSDDDGIGKDLDYATIKPQLIGIDIQARAVQNTKQSLLSSLPSDIYYDHIQVLEQSHEHLMDVPRETSSVGLVCYNLGYLPGARSQENSEVAAKSKETQTQTETTLNSITDASLLLRVGGLLSIMTYPGSNLEESIVVEHFVEGLAMLTSRHADGWRGYVENIPDYDNDDNGKVRDFVTRALERVVEDGEKKQTWRAFVHKPLGRPMSPVLVTAMRIK